MFDRDVEDRYQYIREVVAQGTLFELGIAALKRVPASPDLLDEGPQAKTPEEGDRLNVTIYSVPLLREGLFSVSSDSLRFLARTGFDFARAFSTALPYEVNPQQKPQQNGEGSKLPTSTGRHSRGRKRGHSKMSGEEHQTSKSYAREIIDTILHPGASIGQYLKYLSEDGGSRKSITSNISLSFPLPTAGSCPQRMDRSCISRWTFWRCVGRCRPA